MTKFVGKDRHVTFFTRHRIRAAEKRFGRHCDGVGGWTVVRAVTAVCDCGARCRDEGIERR
jgi:hypothetical protein